MIFLHHKKKQTRTWFCEKTINTTHVAHSSSWRNSSVHNEFLRNVLKRWFWFYVLFYKFFKATSLSSIFESHIRKFSRMHWRQRRHDIRRRKLLKIELRAFDKYNQEVFRQHDIVSINSITQSKSCFFFKRYQRFWIMRSILNESSSQKIRRVFDLNVLELCI
jgi:hypothetical protein